MKQVIPLTPEFIRNEDGMSKCTKENIAEIVHGGRSRWKIENESFNTLKNQGYHLEHNFGHGKHNLSETFFMLNLLAFFFHQTFELMSTEYRLARAEFSSKTQFILLR